MRPYGGEVTATDFAGMMREGHDIASIGSTRSSRCRSPDGVKATQALSDEGLRVNVTLPFGGSGAAGCEGRRHPPQPFVGRLDDIATNRMDHSEIVRFTATTSSRRRCSSRAAATRFTS